MVPLSFSFHYYLMHLGRNSCLIVLSGMGVRMATFSFGFKVKQGVL